MYLSFYGINVLSNTLQKVEISIATKMKHALIYYKFNEQFSKLFILSFFILECPRGTFGTGGKCDHPCPPGSFGKLCSEDCDCEDNKRYK